MIRPLSQLVVLTNCFHWPRNFSLVASSVAKSMRQSIVLRCVERGGGRVAGGCARAANRQRRILAGRSSQFAAGPRGMGDRDTAAGLCKYPSRHEFATVVVRGRCGRRWGKLVDFAAAKSTARGDRASRILQAGARHEAPVQRRIRAGMVAGGTGATGRRNRCYWSEEDGPAAGGPASGARAAGTGSAAGAADSATRTRKIIRTV